MDDRGSNPAESSPFDPRSFDCPPANGDCEHRLTLRPALLIEQRACRMLLPDVAASPDPCNFLVAVHNEPNVDDANPLRVPGQVVGVIVTTHEFLNVNGFGPRVSVHVISPMRRRGIARCLLQRIAEEAARRGADSLFSWKPLSREDPELAAWRALGFLREVSIIEHQIRLSDLVATLEPLFERLKVRGKIPGDAAIVRMDELSAHQLDQLAKLHARELGGSETHLRSALGRGSSYVHPAISTVLLRGERVVGFAIGRKVGPDTCTVDANVVDAEHRRRWANTWLKLEGAKLPMKRGLNFAEFQSFEHQSDTRSVASRFGGKEMRRLMRLAYPIEDAGVSDGGPSKR